MPISIAAGTRVVATIFERLSVTARGALDAAAGRIRFTDPGQAAHLATVAGVTVSGTSQGLSATTDELLQAFALGTVIEPTATVAGSVRWVFSAPDSMFDDLAAGETATLHYAVNLDDRHGGVVTQDVAVTVVGANDRPRIGTATAVTGTFSELAATTGSAALDTAGGAFQFSDADLSDNHAATVLSVGRRGAIAGLPAAADLADFLTVSLTEPTTGAAGVVTWSFAAADGVFDYLAEGQTVALTYTVRLDDGHGGRATRDVQISIAGTNDAPEIVAGTLASASLAERPGVSGAAARDTATGVIRFADPDRADHHTAKVLGVAASGTSTQLPAAASLLAFLKLGHVVEPTATAAGVVGWRFSAPDKTFDYLNAGETVTLTYTVQIDDKHTAASPTQDIVVTITGSNDAPVASAHSGRLTPISTPLTLTAASLLAGAHDADAGNVLSLVSVQDAKHGTVSLDAGGNAIFTPTVNYEGPASFTYTIADGHGGSSTAKVSLRTYGTTGSGGVDTYWVDLPPLISGPFAYTGDGTVVTPGGYVLDPFQGPPPSGSVGSGTVDPLSPIPMTTNQDVLLTVAP